MAKTYTYILNYGRSGSTLLDWALDSHPQILGLGEINRLSNAFAAGTFPNYCGCGAKLTDCPFWQPVLEHSRTASRDFGSWYGWLLRHVQAHKPEADVLLDSSGPLPPLQRFLASELARQYNVKILFLTRDARGVVFSSSKRGSGPARKRRSLLRATASWAVRYQQCVQFLRQLPPQMFLHVTYERFCSQPDKTLRQIQQFVGVEPLGLAPDWGQRIHHTFAGNFRLRDNPRPIAPDLEWTHGLSPFDMCVIELLTGKLNRALLSGTVFPPTYAG